MAKDKLTYITMVLDRSGSMSSIRDAVITSFNEFISEQQKIKDDICQFTMVQFDHEYNVVYDNVSIHDVEDLDKNSFEPRGSTALNDAIGFSINNLEKRIKDMPEDERPSKVLFVIITDGQENASKEFKGDQVKSLIDQVQKDHNWQFSYLAANQDAFSAASSMGMGTGGAAIFTASVAGYAGMTKGLTASVVNYRCSTDAQSQFMYQADPDDDLTVDQNKAMWAKDNLIK